MLSSAAVEVTATPAILKPDAPVEIPEPYIIPSDSINGTPGLLPCRPATFSVVPS